MTVRITTTAIACVCAIGIPPEASTRRLPLADRDVQVGHDLVDVRNGRAYRTVTIGEQQWMAEDLAATMFGDGVPIPLVTGRDAWAALSTPAYSWYDESDGRDRDRYGLLYNWYAVDTGRLCPAAWHVPTDADWTRLETTLGLSLDEVSREGIRGAGVGARLKEAGLAHWQPPNAGATNGSGFSGRPGGHRNWASGEVVDRGLFGTWWSTTEASGERAWRRTLATTDDSVRRFSSHKRDGFAVRCVK